MKAMIIGGAGFIGSHLCDALVDLQMDVVCIDDLSLGSKNNIAHLLDDDKIVFEQADVSNQDITDSLFERYRPDIVYHLAANSDIQASSVNPDIEYKNTYSTTFSVLQTMRKYNIKKLFFSSTSAVYGDKRDIMLDENTPNLSPVSYYGAAKLGSEALISAYSYMNDMSCMIFRFPNVIGPRLTHGVIYDFVRKLNHDQEQLEILGDGKQTKPYIYVSDLIDAIVTFTSDIPEGVTLYNIGVNGATSVDRIAEIICEEMDLSNVIFKYTGGESGWKGDVPRFLYCLDKVHEAGWYAKYDSDDAVRMAVTSAIGKSSL